MGAYLSTPATEKKSESTENEKYVCGVSGMQGWRISMEDAHNCVPEMDDDTGLFAVYDGHGGAEVAMYCALHFTEVLKETDEYKEGRLCDAMKSTFMQLDKKLKESHVIKELKLLSEMEPGDPAPTEEDIRKMEEREKEDRESVEDETKLLYEEATMSIEDLLAKYGRVVNETKEVMKFVKQEEEETTSMSSRVEKCEKSDDKEKLDEKAETQTSSNGDAVAKDGLSSEATATTKEETAVENKVDEADSTELKAGNEPTDEAKNTTENKEVKKLKKTFVKSKVAKQDDDDSDDEDYEGFESDEAVEGSSSEDEEEEEDFSDDDDEEDDDVEETIEEEATENEKDSLTKQADMGPGFEEPGADSGTTAVVAILRDLDLHVANAGDSRCILSRKGGVAFDMSDDHKPEDEAELKRIKAAGGHVNIQGRVNGGLNLSRAIGDHCYKKNKDLTLEEQMISAMPDVRSVRLQPGDEFMVLACDGIWNVFSSQEVVDFIRERLYVTKDDSDKSDESPTLNDTKLTNICEELFDKCLAPDTMGDGTGCDNMTCIIIRFKQDWLKNRQIAKTNQESDHAMLHSVKKTVATEIENNISHDNSLNSMEIGDSKIRQNESSPKVSDETSSGDFPAKETNKRSLTEENDSTNCLNGNGVAAKRIKTE